MSGPKGCPPCEGSRRLIVDLSGVPRLRPRGCIPTEHKAMWLADASRSGRLSLQLWHSVGRDRVPVPLLPHCVDRGGQG